MTQTAISEGAVKDLGAQFRGSILRPGDGGYDEARKVFNGMIDRRPGLIVRPADTADVQRAVNFGRANGLLVSIKGGGHAAPGYAVCDDGLMIDLCLMKAITVDPGARTAVAEGGVNWGEFDAATQQHGLAVTGGRIRSTGIAGLTLGSGSGWLERKLGYTVDNMIGAEVVTADGNVIHASADENADLFWGLRGGGGNFGIVTKFEYRLHPIGPIVFGGLLAFPREKAREVLRTYRDFIEKAPDDVGGAAVLITAPSEPFVPEEARGKPAVAVVVCYTGKPEAGEQAMKPILDLNPVVRMVTPMPYVAVQSLLEPGNPPGLRNYWKADMYPELPDAAIDALVEAAANPPSPLTAVIVQPIGGAVHRVADDATAIGWRSAKWALHVLGMWPDASEDERNIAWVRNIASVMQPWRQTGTYLNYLMDEGDQRVRESFGSHYQTMVDLKNKYDPTNFFRMNQNIAPTGNGHR
ncbi:MAG: FAD-binding oxidoreductase [Dehalococcoidia bacterium]|nr:FAD-binding oxidoreductase [Dehalococcoidia bacterium]